MKLNNNPNNILKYKDWMEFSSVNYSMQSDCIVSPQNVNKKAFQKKPERKSTSQCKKQSKRLLISDHINKALVFRSSQGVIESMKVYIKARTEGSLVDLFLSTKESENLVFCRGWWVYENGFWVPKETKQIVSHVFSVINEIGKNLFSYAEKEKLSAYKKKLINQIHTEIATTSMAERIVTGIIDKRSDMHWTNSLDMNWNYIPFKNGKYKIKTGIFSSYKSSDKYTTHTGYAYAPTVNNPAVHAFLKDIFPNPKEHEYFLWLVSTCLDFSSVNNYLHFLVGNRSNGKSMLINLIKETFGSMCVGISPRFLTRIEKDSCALRSDLISLRTARLGLIVKPEQKKMDSFLIKRLCGNDCITTIERFQKQNDFLFRTKLMVVCNSLPSIDNNDEAVQRRIRICLFRTRFVEEPEFLYEKKVNTTVFDSIKNDITWRQTFMNILLSTRKHYNSTLPFSAPKKTETLYLTQFLQENIIITNRHFDILTNKEIYFYYLKHKDLLKNSQTQANNIEDFTKEVLPKKISNEIQDYFMKFHPTAVYKKCHVRETKAKVYGWRGFALNLP